MDMVACACNVINRVTLLLLLLQYYYDDDGVTILLPLKLSGLICSGKFQFNERPFKQKIEGI